MKTALKVPITSFNEKVNQVKSLSNNSATNQSTTVDTTPEKKTSTGKATTKKSTKIGEKRTSTFKGKNAFMFYKDT